MAFKFENLEVWQESIELTGIVHYVSSKFPKDAADSVALNIAEGSTGQSNAEFNRILGYTAFRNRSDLLHLHR